MKKVIIQRLRRCSEKFTHRSEGAEFWLARELQILLGYTQRRNFEVVIDPAKIVREKTGEPVADHYGDLSNMIGLAKGAKCEVADLALTRYARYLLAQNGDPRKETIALR